MEPRKLLHFLGIIEKLKCNTRHSWISNEKQESVAEHCWRTAIMALLVADEFPDICIDKVVSMCLVHDFGEAITGDVPAFYKTKQDEDKEDSAVDELLKLLPSTLEQSFSGLYVEMAELKTPEAKLFKALDNLEGLISHNEAPLRTWLPLEYTLNMTYGDENMAYSEYLKCVREEVKQDCIIKQNETKNCI